MNRLLYLFLVISVFCTLTLNAQQALPVLNETNSQSVSEDWLVYPVTAKANVYNSSDKKDVILDNGLIRRRFRLSPNVACTDYKNKITEQQLLRAVKPEARVVINGVPYNIGGMYGQKENAYLLPEWIDSFVKHDSDFMLTSYNVDTLPPYLKPQTKFWATNTKYPTGKLLNFIYTSPLPQLKGLNITVHYALYDELPLIEKWLSIENKSSQTFRVNQVVNEILGIVEEESAVVGTPELMSKPSGLYIETNYAFNNSMVYGMSDQTTHWKTDKDYTSQVNYSFETPCLLEVYPEHGIGIDLQPDEIFTSVRTFELAMDSYDRQRRGMAIQKMYSTIAPWTTANPIFMHLVSKNDAEVYNAIDQCVATGYEALILSFGSHINMEDTSDANLSRCKKLAEYAHNKGIKIGAYSLFSSRRISEEDDVINPKTGKRGGAFFGDAACYGSKWGLAYRDKTKYFFTVTGFDIWENDGPYPGDLCASVKHPGHRDVEDSQWRQMEIQKELYRWLNAHDVYINAPDWYFLDGTNKISLGYREVNFSLSRAQQKILNRQNIFDGTWNKTPSMSWGFVPLTQYHGGGAEAVLEPLSEHLKDYEQLMMQYYGAGVQACYRGPRLYDTDKSKTLVSKVIEWYKKYRNILNADILHLRRADGRDWDGWMHVSPSLKEKGFVLLFNPTGKVIKRQITLPLYYTGLTQNARIREKEGAPKTYTLNRNYEVTLPVTLEANSYSWWVVE
jgi:hypothetical protein